MRYIGNNPLTRPPHLTTLLPSFERCSAQIETRLTFVSLCLLPLAHCAYVVYLVGLQLIFFNRDGSPHFFLF